MGVREKFEDRISKKESEIRELEAQIREAKAYIQALQDTIRLLPREAPVDADKLLRPGSAVAQARDAIKKAGKPLHISEIVIALGKEPTKENRLSLSGSLAGYVRKEEIFTRPAPNTFGLIEDEYDGETLDGFGMPTANELKDLLGFEIGEDEKDSE